MPVSAADAAGAACARRGPCTRPPLAAATLRGSRRDGVRCADADPF